MWKDKELTEVVEELISMGREKPIEKVAQSLAVFVNFLFLTTKQIELVKSILNDDECFNLAIEHYKEKLHMAEMQELPINTCIANHEKGLIQ